GVVGMTFQLGGEREPLGVRGRGEGEGGGGGVAGWFRLRGVLEPPGRRIRQRQPCHHRGGGGAQAAAQRDVGARADRAARVAHAVRGEAGGERAGEDVVFDS